MRTAFLILVFLGQCFGDSMVFPESTATSQTSSQHPLIDGFGKIFSSLYVDDFITLQPSMQETDSHHTTQDIQSKDIESTKPSATLAQKPKVLLIMDDLSQPQQIKKLEKLPLHITPSLFPKTKYTYQTPTLAQHLSKQGRDFMVHLPLEAQQFAQKELEPLMTGITKDKLHQAIAQIRADFPTLVYINNHTGSKFTQSYADMSHLLDVFDELDLRFVDSVTTPKSASERLAKERGQLIMARDVFLDNQTQVSYIKKQIRNLIHKAQKKGYAIAICHPNANTFKALSQMSDEINASLELVSPSELESYLIQNKIAHYVRSPFH